MSVREKWLATGVVAVLALGACWGALRWGVVGRWQRLARDIAHQKTLVAKLDGELARARGAESAWLSLKPLSRNPHRAAERFRQDLGGLIETHGLKDASYQPFEPRRLKSEFAEVRLKIQTHGTLQQVVNFLCDCYRRGYLLKLEEVNLSAEDSRSGGRTVVSSRRRPGSRSGAATTARVETPSYGPEGPRLSVSVLAVALVLPEIKGLEGQETYQPGAGEPVEGPGRLPRMPQDYAAVWETNLFKQWVPEPVVASTEPPPAPPPKPVQPPPRVTPRPKKKVVGVEARAGELIAYVRDQENLSLATEAVRINQPVDDGTLVLVDPKGMVVQVRGGGVGPDFKYYLYRLGRTFEEREELSASAYPELMERLQNALSP